jgi:hypothetical protein
MMSVFLQKGRLDDQQSPLMRDFLLLSGGVIST